MMKVVFYINAAGKTGLRLQKMIRDLVPDRRKETYSAIDSLAPRLRQHAYNIAAVVLLITSREDLSNILRIRHLFQNIKTILILPDRENETITKGHRLRPRFLSYADRNFVEVAVVLEKMLENVEF